jgi:hypothetical protein
MSAAAGSMTSPRRSQAQLSRDAALLRVVRTRRFVIAGAAALTAGFAAVVSSIAPARTVRRTAAVPPTATRAKARSAPASLKMPPLASPGDLGLQGPTSVPQVAQSSSAPSVPAPSQQSAPVQAAPAPAPVPAAPTVVSGGS